MRVKMKKEIDIIDVFFSISLISPWIVMVILFLSSKVKSAYSGKTILKLPFLSALIISAIGYCSYNYQFGDLGILTDILISLKNADVYSIWNSEISKSIGIFNWIYYLIAQCEDYNLLTGVTAFIVYYIYGKITLLTSLENKISYKEFVCIYFWGILSLQFFSILEHGRIMASFALFLYGTYREKHLKKKDLFNYVLYFTALTMHTATFLLVILRIFVKIFKSNRFFTIIAICSLFVIMPMLESSLAFLPEALREYVSKVNTFLEGNSNWGNYVYTSRFYILQRYVFFVMLALEVMSTFYLKKNRIKEEKYDYFLEFVFEIIFISIVSNSVVSDAYWRLGTTAFLVFPYILICMKSHMRKESYQAFFWLTAGIALLITAMQLSLVYVNDLFVMSNFIDYALDFNFISVMIMSFQNIMIS